MPEVPYPVGHLLANLLLHILTLGCACAARCHSLLAGNQTMSIQDVSLAIRVWIVFRIHPYVSTANVMASPVDRLHTCPSQPHKCLRCPSKCRSQPPLNFYGSDLSVSGLTLWHDHPRILASWGATTNTRVVRLHAGRADLLLHHLEREDFKSFSFSVTWYWQGF